MRPNFKVPESMKNIACLGHKIIRLSKDKFTRYLLKIAKKT